VNRNSFIADEPTTALDVTVQSQVLMLLNRLRDELGMALIMISHDLGVIAATCDFAQVMYGGRVVERGHIREILTRPNHPYTAALLRLVPRIDGPVERRLAPIPGQPAPVFGVARGCCFRHALRSLPPSAVTATIRRCTILATIMSAPVGWRKNVLRRQRR
jgi:peptide/nickel transport system ATP-binding protein